MICYIAQNGGCMILILFLCILATNTTIIKDYTVQEFCSRNLFMHNIEPGESYKLTLRNEQSAAGSISKWFYKSKRKCHQEFKTSDSSAHFEVSISNMNIPSCPNCGCSYFAISTLGHGKRFCGHEDDTFLSKTDSLFIDFHPGLSMPFDVTFTFSVKRNFYIVTGTSTSVPIIIETPYFPISYPPNYSVEYLLQCSDLNSHVMLNFLDFQVSHNSFIEVTGNNGTHSTRYYGNVFRPFIKPSQSDRLNLKFVSNNQPGMFGFRTEFSCIKSVDPLYVPYTECSSSKDGRNGYLQIKTHGNFGLYDCVWHIISVWTLRSKMLYRSVTIHVRHVGNKGTLEIRNATNSKSGIIVKNIDCSRGICSNHTTEIVVSALDDLYIRFNGYLEPDSVVSMSYNTYHMGNCSNNELKCKDGRCLSSDLRCDGIEQCPGGIDEDSCPYCSDNEFKCTDGRCLSSDFRCDGIKHCPDGTDEDSCPPSDVHRIQTELYNNTINQKFLVVALLGSFGLVTVIISVLIFLAKRCKQTTTQESSRQTVGELSDAQPTLFQVNSYDCENPPSYEDFIKSSDNYPPILYTRANRHFASKANCTTSFCTGARARHYSVDSFNVRSSDTGSDIFLNITGDDSHPLPNSSNMYNIEINQNLSFRPTKHTIKRCYSLDSKLNNLVSKDSCNLFLSIIHPVCTHMPNHCPQVQCHTLPSNFKINSVKTSYNNGPRISRPDIFQRVDSGRNFFKGRCFTWSFGPHRSVESEIVTIVKTRCFSDPCKGINLHYSSY